MRDMDTHKGGFVKDYHHCRVHNANTNEGAKMFKYAARHWAHFRCWLWSRVPELPKPVTEVAVVRLLATLHVHELNDFPVMAVADVLESYGYYERSIVVMKAAIRLAKGRENAKGPGAQTVRL